MTASSRSTRRTPPPQVGSDSARSASTSANPAGVPVGLAAAPGPASGAEAPGPPEVVVAAGRSGAVAHPSARQTRTVAGPLTGGELTPPGDRRTCGAAPGR